MTTKLRRAVLALSASTLALASGEAWAQDAGPAPASKGSPAALDPQQETAQEDDLAEIIVTAQKREERLVDVPLAVTAVSGEQLLDRQVNNVNDLEEAVPSLTFTQSTNEQNSNLRIRGVGTALFGTGFESSVSIVLDGVVLARQGQGFVDLVDIERVEVLRGPQGTLFGKNASAGVINVVTRRPSDELTFFGDATVAELDEYRFRGSLSGPLGEGLGFRLTGFYTDVGGHILNVATGRRINGVESYGVRGKLDWEPTDRLNVLLIGDYRKSESTCCQYQSRFIGNPVFLAAIRPVVPSERNDQVNVNGFVGGGTEQYGVSLQAGLDLGGVGTLTSISAYRSWDFSNNQDVDGTNNPVPLLGLTQLDLNGGTTDIRQVSQEFRLDSPGNRRLSYTLGLYYFGLQIDRFFQRRIGACLPSTALPAALRPGLASTLGQNNTLSPGQACRFPIYTSFDFTSDIEQDSYSAFGQAELDVVGGLSLIGGLRFTHETQDAEGNRPGDALFPGDLDLNPTTPNPPFPLPDLNPLSNLRPSAGSASVKDTDLSGKAGVQYRFSRNAQAYLTYTRGYKGRGFDTEVTSDFTNLVALLPETVDAYELGAKAVAADGRFSVNAALFFSRYQNLQIQGFDREAALFRPINAGESDVKGLEIEFNLRPGGGFSFNGGVTALDAKTDIAGIACYPGQPTVTVAAGAERTPGICYRTQLASGAFASSQDVEGGRLPNAPDFRLALTGRYENDLPGVPVGLFAQIGAVLQDDTIYDITQDPLTQQDGFVTVDASVGLTDDDGRFTLSLFVENLFDANFVQAVARDPLSAVSTIHFRPKDANRYFGATLRVNLGR